MVAAEQGEEAGLRAGRALGAAEGQLVAPAFQFVQVEDEVVAATGSARLPTVVSCAGWKCVKPSVGSSFQVWANAPRASMTAASVPHSVVQRLRIRMRSALSVT